jgi:V/A-type H+-transporting ATPase subunit C
MPLISSSIRQLVENFRYAYPSARARALKSMLLTEEHFDVVLDARNLNDALHLLRETPYGPALSGEKKVGEVEVWLNSNLAATFVKVSDFLPGRAKDIFKLYLNKYEVENIKSVFVGIQRGLTQKMILQRLVPLKANLDLGHYEKMASSKTIGEAASVLTDTLYHTPKLNQAIKEYEEAGLLFQIDVALDFLVYNKIFEVISTSFGADVAALKKMIGIEIDIKNIKSILRLRDAHVKPQETVNYLIPRGYRLGFKELEELSRALDVEEIISRLAKTFYYQPLISAKRVSEKTRSADNIIALEKALDDFLLEVGKGFERDFPLGIGPVLGYVIAKSGEVKRLIAILKLKDEDFSNAEIREIMKL